MCGNYYTPGEGCRDTQCEVYQEANPAPQPDVEGWEKEFDFKFHGIKKWTANGNVEEGKIYQQLKAFVTEYGRGEYERGKEEERFKHPFPRSIRSYHSLGFEAGRASVVKEVEEIANGLTPFSLGVPQDPLISKEALISKLKS